MTLSPKIRLRFGFPTDSDIDEDDELLAPLGLIASPTVEATKVVQLHGTDEVPPRFVRFDVHHGHGGNSLCAADEEGQLYEAGWDEEEVDDGPWLLRRLQPGPPVPVRSLLACTRPCPCGSLALLVDGTVWRMTTQRLLPLLCGVTAMRRSPVRRGAVCFTGPRRPKLEIEPVKLSQICDWQHGGGVRRVQQMVGSEDAGRDLFRRMYLQHDAVILPGGALIVGGVGPGSLRPDLGKPPKQPDRGQLEHDLEESSINEMFDMLNLRLDKDMAVAEGRGELVPLDGERAANVWIGRCWTVVLTLEGSLWVWGGTANAVPPGASADRHSPGRRLGQWVVTAPTRVTRLADGMEAPRFTTAAAGETLGVLCLCAQDCEGRLYACDRHSAGLTPRLLARVPGNPPRDPARELLAAPEPLVHFNCGRVWSVRSARLLAVTDVQHIRAVLPPFAPTDVTRGSPGDIVIRRRGGRTLVVDPEALWAATWCDPGPAF